MKRVFWIALLVVTVALFYWKILFTKQFSILWLWEPVTQSYSWYQFAAAAIHQGVLPLWDPYRFSGTSFIGEMQTGLLYPLKWLAYVAPFDASGLLSERIYNEIYVLTHVLAALFMFFLARHLGLSRLASYVAGVCFSLGGYLLNTGHPHTLDSGIWLPLILLFFLRGVEAESITEAACFTCLSGAAVGVAILGGGLHMVIMDAIVIVTAGVVLAVQRRRPLRIAGVAAGLALAGFLCGAVQLLPAWEFSALTYRFVGGGPIRSLDKVPYADMGESERLSPRSVFAFLLGSSDTGAGSLGNYFGVVPFFLCIAAVLCCWREPWVRYFAVLALMSYLYAWGSFSFLHGLLYVLPVLDIAREASRFVYLTHFAMAILAAYGVDLLFRNQIARDDRYWAFVRGVRWLTIVLTVLLLAGAMQSTVPVDDWFYLSFMFIAVGWILLETIGRGHRSVWMQLALVFVILWDAYEFDWVIRSKAIAQSNNQDHMAELQSSGRVAAFLKSKGEAVRVDVEGDSPPNIGDVYGISMTGGMSATILTGYAQGLDREKQAQLLNVRYRVRRTNLPNQTPVFSDGKWQVYENSMAGPRAWVVHQVEIEKATPAPLKRLIDSDFMPQQTAVVEQPLTMPLDASSSTDNDVELLHLDPETLEFRVRAHGRGLLVVSEVFYPGWQARVNGKPFTIYKTDGFLRGVEVPDGESHVILEFRPQSFRLGALLTLGGFLAAGAATWGVFSFKRSRSNRMVHFSSVP